jgi:DNA-nicking Smr family endonuclease
MDKNTSSEDEIFINAMHDVIPINKNKIAPKTNYNINIKKTNYNSIQFDFKQSDFNTSYKPEEIIEIKKSGVDLKHLETKNIQYSIDLHELTIDQAGNKVYTAIEQCYTTQQRYLKIITGKGQKAILKTAVINWLTDNSKVLGFKTAPNSDGGAGCLYVLIKKRRNS